MKITHASLFGAGKGETLWETLWETMSTEGGGKNLYLQLTLKVGAIQRHANASASEQHVVVEVDVFFFAMVAQLGVGGCGAVHDGDTGVLNVVQLEVERVGEQVERNQWKRISEGVQVRGEQVGHCREVAYFCATIGA